MIDLNSLFSQAVEVPWFDMEFLASKELAEFYVQWKDKQVKNQEALKNSVEKEKRRKIYEDLKKEFDN